MLTPKLEKALNAHLNLEFWSAYLYLSMSAFCTDKGFNGVAHWFLIQAREEQEHALSLFRYIMARCGKVTLIPVAEVPTDWNSMLHVFEHTLEHEQHVTELVHALNLLAINEQDFATQNRLRWFIDDQVE